MEEQWVADRCRLRDLLRAHPDGTKQQCAQEIGRSIGWVKQWRRRLREATDDTARWSRSRARIHPPPTISQPVIDRILAIRDQPPANRKCIPGPRAIRSYLHHDTDLIASGERLPRSTRPVWQILTAHGRIAPRSRHHHEPLDRPPPLTVWQLDCKAVASVPADPDGKRQHVVATLNTVDTGTAILRNAPVRADFTAETTLEAVVQTLQMHGLPAILTIDRDPRFVGAATGRDFPSPFVRFLTCLGVAVAVCPPQRPDKHAFVERDHRTYDRACLKLYRPTTEGEAEAVTAAFAHHDTEERPNQAITCGNRPPRVAFPRLPVRPALPAQVDPDRWLQTIAGRRFVRKVRDNGTVAIEDGSDYTNQKRAGQYVVLEVEAAAQALIISHRHAVLKAVPINGRQGGPLP